MKFLIILFLTSLCALANSDSIGISIGSPTAISGRFSLSEHLFFAAIAKDQINLDYNIESYKVKDVEEITFFLGAGITQRRVRSHNGIGVRGFVDFNYDLNQHIELFAKSSINMLFYDQISNFLDLAIGARYKF